MEDWKKVEMEIGDLVKCIYVSNSKGLTIGRTYRVISLDKGGDPEVINDNCIKSYYCNYRFVNITKDRRDKLRRLNEKVSL